MTNSTGLHHLALVTSASGEPDVPLARAEPRLGLPTLDQLALTSFVTGDAAQLVVEHARSLETILAKRGLSIAGSARKRGGGTTAV